MKANQANNSRRRPKAVRTLTPEHPPSFSASLVIKRRLRFSANTAASAEVVPAASLMDLMCAASSATSASQMGSHVRIHSIELWGPPSATLVPVTVSIDWTGTTAGLFGKSQRISDTSIGATTPAYVKSKPPAGSQVGSWFNANTAVNVCTLAYPANTILDLVYSVVLRDDGTTTAVTGAVAGATAGAIYIRSFNSATNSIWTPVSNATI